MTRGRMWSNVEHEELITMVQGLKRVIKRMMRGRKWSMRSLSPWSLA